MGGDDLSKGNQILIWIKSNIPSNSHWASKGQAGIEFPFCCRTGRREANCSKNDKQGIARQGIEPKHQAGLILLMDLLQEICFNFGNRGEELGDFRMKTPNLRDFGMFVLLFQAKKCAFFSGNSPWCMFHGTTCPFGNSTCGIWEFALSSYTTPILSLVSLVQKGWLFSLFMMWLKAQSSDCSILPGCSPAVIPNLSPSLCITDKNPGR